VILAVAEKTIFVGLLKNAPAFAEAASRRQADARRPKSSVGNGLKPFPT